MASPKTFITKMLETYYKGLMFALEEQVAKQVFIYTLANYASQETPPLISASQLERFRRISQ